MRPEYSKESIRGAVTKAQKIVKNNEIVPGFDSNKRFVKNSSFQQPHIFIMERVTYVVIRIVSISVRGNIALTFWQ